MKKGIWFAVGAYVFWGLFPVYWKLLGDVPALQLLGHRIVWSFLLLVPVLLFKHQVGVLCRQMGARVLLIYSLGAVLIGINWLTYVWAIGANFIVETSLGYYINPLLSVLLGVIFLRERMRMLQWAAICLAGGGVIYLTLAYGALPWIALTLAFTFGLYGLVKKTAPLNSLHGLTLETGILFLPALAFLFYSEFSSAGVFLRSDLRTNVMLIGAGAVTVFPLLLFAAGARRIPLTTMGILQYMNPTMQFLLGVIVYHEPFTRERWIGFSIVWTALLLYALEGLIHHKKKRGKGSAIIEIK